MTTQPTPRASLPGDRVAVQLHWCLRAMAGVPTQPGRHLQAVPLGPSGPRDQGESGFRRPGADPSGICLVRPLPPLARK